MSQACCPAILVAAPASGQGKTTVAAALARLHARQGRRVRVFKCGPDFLDPLWLELASGAPVYQLDLWMTGEADCRARLQAAACEAELIIVEGVMGLFDGAPSAADLAQRFGLPVLAVIDASAMAGTFGALAFGLQHYRGGLRWAGVLANRVAGAGHAQMLQGSLRDSEPWLGALLRDATFALPERHLGLTVTSEVGDALARLDAAADALALTRLGQMPLPAMSSWTWSESLREGRDANTPGLAPAGDLPSHPDAGLDAGTDRRLPSGELPLAGRTVAVARDGAFCFIYPANLDTLCVLGARVVFFSPLRDRALPPCDALWLPGGYPELHAEALAANTALRDSLMDHVAQRKPVWAECGGMLPLFDSLSLLDGSSHAMWGLLPGVVTMQPRLVALGPQALQLGAHVLRGHTFHYSRCATSLAARTRTAPPGAEPQPEAGEAVYQQGSLRASYFHAWFASSPPATAALFAHNPEESDHD